VLDNARDRQETEPSNELNGLIAALTLAYEHVGRAVAPVEPPDPDYPTS
jgi:hypothetical protein